MIPDEFKGRSESPDGRHSHGGNVIDGRVVSVRPGAGAVHLCHHGCDCWQRNFDRYLDITPERDPDELDSVEAHALLVAKDRAIRHLRRHVDAMQSARRRVIDSHHDAEAAVNDIKVLLADGTIGAAARERARLTATRTLLGVTARPLWLRIIAWPGIVGVGAFDTWYFKSVFQQLSGNTQNSGPEEAITWFPGIGLALGMVISGVVLGGPVHRAARTHAERQRRRNGLTYALAATGWWALRLLLPCLLLLVAGGWAVHRVLNEGQLPAPWLVALLLITLSLCAIAMKVAAYDPLADAEAAALRRRIRCRILLSLRLRRARKRIRRHSVMWSDLCALRDDIVSRISERYGSAYQFITYARGFHQKAGKLPPVFAVTSTVKGGTSALPADVGDELTGVSGPEPEFGALLEVQQAIEQYAPDALRAELSVIQEEVITQRSSSA